MKNFLKAALFAKDARIGLVLTLTILGFIVLGCGGSKGDFKPVPAAFHGNWSSSEGTTMNISSDGTVVYRSGATKIDNGAAELDENTKILKLSLLGVSRKEFKVDQMPSGGKMKLDGVMYQTGGKAIPEGSDSPTPADGDGDGDDNADLPSESEQNALVKDTMQDFADAVQKGDFTDFRDNCSAAMKSSVSNEQFKQNFDAFIKQKNDLVPILKSTAGMTPDYSPAANFSQRGDLKLLNLKGTYDTARKTTFELQYASEDGDWKLSALRVRIEPPAK